MVVPTTVGCRVTTGEQLPTDPTASVGPALAETIFDLAPDAIIVATVDGRITSANHRARELFGYDEFTDVAVDDLVPAGARNVHASHRAAYGREPRTRSMGTGLDLSAARQDGSTFPVEVALAPIHLGAEGTGVVAIVRDVTERIEAQRRINEIQQTLDGTEEGVYVFDADTLLFDYVNQGAADQLGRSRAEMEGMSVLDLNPTMAEADYRALIQPLLAGRMSSRTIATRHRRKDGSELEVECVLQSSEVPHPDGHRRIVAFCRDVTVRLETERQLRAAEQELGVLEDRERIARDLHDTVIQRLFAAGMTLQAAAVKTDEATSARVIEVVDELDLTIREIRQAIFRLTVHNLDAASVRRRVVDVVDAEQAALGFAPELAFNGPLETVGEAVVEHLIATLREALSNAARHADARTVRVTVDVGDDVCLVVDDDGIGLPPEPGSGGHGLANMADRAATIGGTVRVEPRDPRGTRVTWRVPMSLP